MPQYNMLQDADIEPLGQSVFAVLEKVGILCQNRELLEALAERGARVDFNEESVTFPERMSALLLDQIRAESPSSADAREGRFVAPPLPGLGTQIAQFYYDYGSGQRRSGNRADFIELIKLGSVLHPEDPVGHALLLTDVPPMMEPLEAALLLAEYALDPSPAFAWNVRQVDYLAEMGEILGCADWFSWGAICFAHPLRFDRDVVDKLVRRAQSGYATGLTAMPVAGVSTPLPIPGFIAVAAAEIFATWLAVRALNPATPLSGSIWGGSMDMKTGAVSYSSFDAMAYSFALAEFLRKWTGIDLPVGGGEYCDAKEPGYFAAQEKAYKSMTIAAFTGHHPNIGQGMLDEGKVLCPVQLLLERELSTGVELFARTVEVSPQTICLDSIIDVGFGLEKNYLGTDETLYNYRQHLWCPELADRSGWNGAETDATVLQRLDYRVHSLIDSYEKPEVDPDQLASMRAVVERARRELQTQWVP